MKYEKPDLEEMELELEGSFLRGTSYGVEVKPGGDDDGEFEGEYD